MEVNKSIFVASLNCLLTCFDKNPPESTSNLKTAKLYDLISMLDVDLVERIFYIFSRILLSFIYSPGSGCSKVTDEGLTLETSAKHHIPQATNKPYQPC